jgi:hypothetical protein
VVVSGENMNASSLARSYGALTAEERFRLVAAAGARGDEVEQERLVRAARRFRVSMPDHSPYGHAFNELSILVFVELMGEAARYQEAFDRADDIHQLFEEDEEKDETSVNEPEGRSRDNGRRCLV